MKAKKIIEEIISFLIFITLLPDIVETYSKGMEEALEKCRTQSEAE